MARSFFLAVALLGALVASLEAALALDIGKLYGEPSLIGTRPGNVVWAPDSSAVAFTWNDAGEPARDIWLWSPDLAAPERLTTHGPEASVGQLAWLTPDRLAYVLGDTLMLHERSAGTSRELMRVAGLRSLSPSPSGDRLAYVTGKGVWVVGLAGDGAAPRLLLTAHSSAERLGRLQWTANGERLAVLRNDSAPLPEREIHYETREGPQISRVRRAFPGEPTARFRIAVIDVAPGMVRELPRDDDTHYIWNFVLSADGRRVFVSSSDLLVKTHRIDLLEVNTGRAERFYEEHDANHLRPDWRAAWAPGEEGLLILTDRSGFLHLHHQRAPDDEPRALTTGPWEIADFHLDAAGGWAYFLANRSHPADRQLLRVPVDGGAIEVITTGPGTHAPVYSPDGRHAVSLFSDDRTPHDLYHLALSEAGAGPVPMTRITHSPRPAFAAQRWATVRYIEFPSRSDEGVTLIGRLSLPPDHDPARPYPLIVGSVYSDSVTNQWGGRQAHPTWGLDQALVARGYLLLSVNVRGSWGQGRAHNQGLRHGYGIVDIEDLHSGVEYLVREGYADPARVGIWGSSYGGLMTLMSLFKKPGVYAAGIAGAPASNVAHAYPAQRWVMGPETGDDQPGRYESQSPLFHSAGLADPLMIIHGTRDPVVLYSDTIALVEDLIDREQPFELVTLPGVGHGWDAEAPSVRRFAFRKMIDFFDRHLGTKAVP